MNALETLAYHAAGLRDAPRLTTRQAGQLFSELRAVHDATAALVTAGAELLRCLRSQGITDEELETAIADFDAATVPFGAEVQS